MISFFNKSRFLVLLGLLSLNTMSSSLMAWDCCDPCDPCGCNRIYIGGFGGGIYSSSSRATQLGTAFFTEAAGGPLAVNARGNINSTSSGFGGVQLGYEWSNGYRGWISPALELEAFWYSHTKSGDLINPTDRLPEHDFVDTFPMRTGVYLANAVFSFNNSSFRGFSPYVGGGVGAARISISGASSIQIDPPEVGVNHFNSQRSDSTWAFAAQVKAGLRYNFFKSFHIFGEYRYLFIDSSNYILGSTVYPAHAPTSPWNVNIKNIHYNAFVFGIQYDL